MRVVGKRRYPVPEGPHWPTSEEARWTEDAATMAGVAPKGVFRYRSHRDANADMESWQGDAMARKALEMDRRKPN